MDKKKILFFAGKIIIVGVFLYFGIGSILEPSTYTNLVPTFLSSIASPNFIVVTHGVTEVICALFILFGLGGIAPIIILCILLAATLMSISGTTLIRDIGILGGLFLLLGVYIDKE